MELIWIGLKLTFSNCNMSHIGNKIFKNHIKPKIYIGYVNDIFILASNKKKIEHLKTTFKNSLMNIAITTKFHS